MQAVRLWHQSAFGATSAALGALLSPLPAQAAEKPQVQLELAQCPELSTPDVRRVFAAELGARLAEAPGPGVTQATVVCRNGRALIRVRDPLSRKAVSRRIDLADAAPRARARLIGIATAELVLASWSELETNPEPRVPPAGPAPPPAARRAARQRVLAKWPALEPTPAPFVPRQRSKEQPRPVRVVAVASRRAFFSHAGALWGGGLSVGQERFADAAWALDAVFDRGRISSELGTYEIETATIGARLFFYHQWSWLTARVGAGLRAGLARSTQVVRTEPGGTSTIAPWGWPLGAASISVQPISSLVVEAAAETSYVSLPVTESEQSLKGVWFDAELGLGVEL